MFVDFVVVLFGLFVDCGGVFIVCGVLFVWVCIVLVG